MQRFCAYQDRCHQEVRNKLLNLKVYGEELEEVITDLIKDDFLNEERFAKSYSRGKFRMKKWGRIKILQGLKFRRISDYCIKKGMLEIEDDEYKSVLQEILEKQIEKHMKLGKVLAIDKSLKYAISRGYETGLVFETLKKID